MKFAETLKTLNPKPKKVGFAMQGHTSALPIDGLGNSKLIAKR